MRITKCDACKKIIKSLKEENSIGINGGIFGKSLSLCDKCFAPVLKVLKKTKLMTGTKK